MAFLIGVLSIQILIWQVSKFLRYKPFQSFWAAARLALPIMFTQIGVVHVLNPLSLSYMIDNFVPFAEQVIILTGIFEILVPWGLLFVKIRKWAAYLLIAYLVAVFPANVNVAINGLSAPGGLPGAAWYTWSRLIFQLVYIWWIRMATFSAFRINKS